MRTTLAVEGPGGVSAGGHHDVHGSRRRRTSGAPGRVLP